MAFNEADAPAIGRAIYCEKIHPTPEPEHKGKVVIIDVKSGDYEIADRHITAARQLRKRRPDAFTWEEWVDVPVTLPGTPQRRDQTLIHMIRGTVSRNSDGGLEACITKSVMDAAGEPQRCEVIVDTGFTGWLIDQPGTEVPDGFTQS